MVQAIEEEEEEDDTRSSLVRRRVFPAPCWEHSTGERERERKQVSSSSKRRRRKRRRAIRARAREKTAAETLVAPSLPRPGLVARGDEEGPGVGGKGRFWERFSTTG